MSVTPATLMGSTSLAAPFTYFTGFYPGLNGTCGFTLPAAGTCTLEVSFNPVGVGPFADSIDINYNNGLGAVVSSRPIQGNGALPAALSFAESPAYNFGTTVVGGSSTHVFTLNNTGGVPSTTLNTLSLHHL